MSVIDTLTGKAHRDAKKEAEAAKDHKEKTQVDLDDSVKKATAAIDKMLEEKRRKATAGKE